MKAVIISYTLKKLDPKQRIAIHRSLYSYIDHSNKGEYQYKRKGLIESFPSLKINRGVVIVPEKHKKGVMDVLKKNKANVISIPIQLKESLLH